MTRIFVDVIAASLAFALRVDRRLRPRPAREGDSGRRRHSRLGERNPARVQRGRRAEIHESFGDRPGRRRASRGGENGLRQSGCADRADLQTPVRRRVQSALAGGLGRHASHPGNLRIHREAMTGRRSGRRQRTDNETFSYSPWRSLSRLSAAPALGAGVQGRRHRGRKTLGARDTQRAPRWEAAM